MDRHATSTRNRREQAGGASEIVQKTLAPGDGPDVDTLVALLALRGREQRDDVVFTYLRDGEVEAGTLTFGTLAMQAQKLATVLRDLGCAGQRVLLLYPQGLEFVTAFFGTLQAGAAAVPAPHAKGSRASTARLLSIVADSRPHLALTTPALHDETAAALAADHPQVLVTTIEALLARGASGGALPLPRPGDLALVQYTSGSTGAPRGVMISHANIMANEALIRQSFEHRRETVFVGWLPMFHDMGLIGNLLQPIHAGCRCVLMSPSAFLEEPIRWLRAITRYRGTTGGAPNFAYDFCVDRTHPADRADLDLRSWDIAYNGSEPVRARTLDRFVETFAPHGFRRQAFYPCYGMSEATLLIAGGDKAQAPARLMLHEAGQAPRAAVASGWTRQDHQILIVDPESRAVLDDGATGEIWFAGPSVGQGYWNRPEETAAQFAASPAGRDDPRWLRTGDLGFVRQGELFVTGRIKDVMILRGKNHYPQDLEATAQAAHPGLRPDCGAAFLIEQGDRQAVVLVHEVTHRVLQAPPLAEIAAAVRAAASREHGLHVAAVALLRPGTLPKTTSGKIQRRQTRQLYLTGDLPLLGEDRHGPAFWRPDPMPATDPVAAPETPKIGVSP